NRMEVCGELGIRVPEGKFPGLVPVKPYPALLGSILFHTVQFLEGRQQTFLVEYLVLQPDGLKEFPSYRCQDLFLGHGRVPQKAIRAALPTILPDGGRGDGRTRPVGTLSQLDRRVGGAQVICLAIMAKTELDDCPFWSAAVALHCRFCFAFFAFVFWAGDRE